MRQRVFLFFLSVIAAVTSFSQTTTTEKLIGEWVGTDAQKQTGSVKFIDKTKAVLNVPGNGIFESTYTIDLSKNPIRCDFTFLMEGKKMMLKSLMLYVDESTLKWQLIRDEKGTWIKPETRENTLVLKKHQD